MDVCVGGREKEREGIGNMRGEEREGAYLALPLLLVSVYTRYTVHRDVHTDPFSLYNF